jgi:hypothetical protein
VYTLLQNWPQLRGGKRVGQMLLSASSEKLDAMEASIRLGGDLLTFVNGARRHGNEDQDAEPSAHESMLHPREARRRASVPTRARAARRDVQPGPRRPAAVHPHPALTLVGASLAPDDASIGGGVEGPVGSAQAAGEGGP